MAAHPMDATYEIGRLEPDVTLLDLADSQGPRWVRQLVAAHPALRVIAVGLEEAEGEVLAWAEAGAAGYVGRDACLEEVLAAIEGAVTVDGRCSIRTGGIRVNGRTDPSADLLGDRGAGRHITAREAEIVRLIGQGLSNEQIARHLYIALPTVKNHVHNILEKLGVSRRIEAVREVRRAGFVL